MKPDGFLDLDAGSTATATANDDALEAFLAARELVATPQGGVRQAGSDREGAQIAAWRKRAEESLYFLARGVLGCWWLTPTLHKPICEWLGAVPPRRKMLLIPRGHGKTTIVGQVLPIHMWIQPAASNRYFPGLPGTHTRILMCGETETRAKDHMRVVQAHFETNDVLRGLWPNVVWQNPKRESRKWNDTEMIVRRDVEFPDPSMRGIGVGGAATGAHPNVLIKDDLTTEAAANSPLIMQTAIDWHINSRALLANPHTDLEFITGTRWAAADMPDYVMTKDPTVEVNTDWRTIVDGAGKPIYPENFGQPGAIEALMKQFGTRFPLLYMNSVEDAQLVDFHVSDLRFYDLQGDSLTFADDDNDVALAQALNAPLPRASLPLRGRSIHDRVTQEALRGKFLRRDRSA